MSFPVPDTRLSLLIRLSDPTDQVAWEEFATLYYPVIYRTARCKGLQDSDALDVAQQVLISVGRSLSQRPHDPSRARFRTWLSTITRNAAINAMRTHAWDRVTGDSETQRQLEQVEDRDSDDELLEQEYQKERFRRAARMIEHEFAADTWTAFWLSTVEEQPIEEVAKRLGKRVGSIYAARSRIMRRLKEQIDLS